MLASRYVMYNYTNTSHVHVHMYMDRDIEETLSSQLSVRRAHLAATPGDVDVVFLV